MSSASQRRRLLELIQSSAEAAAAASPASPTGSEVLQDYLEAFAPERRSDEFLTYYTVGADKSLVGCTYTRGDFWLLARKAASVLVSSGLKQGDMQTHFFSGNTLGDVVFRLASVMLGTTPITINWQADTPDRVVYKVHVTKSKLVLVDSETPKDVLELLRNEEPSASIFDVDDLEAMSPLPETDFCCDPALGMESTRIVIFTSGTTGNPKGVKLSYSSYRCNRATFESFLQVGDTKQLVALITNPLHHTNSTSISDWAMRKPGAQLHLVSRYTTQYWSLLARVGTGIPLSAAVSEDELRAAIVARPANGQVIVAPLVSRHFDFLDGLITSETLPMPPPLLKQALSDTILLLGSAPVGPTTVARLQSYAGRLPVVRFGSTETCLQVMGTPLSLSEEQRLGAFKAGWAHTYNDRELTGYYIGRPHPPYTECRVVKSVELGAVDYMVDCAEGEPGQLVTRGDNIMSGYVDNPKATAKAIHEGGWYTNLGDITYWLSNADDSGRDYYWQSRDSSLLIRGGSNYSYEQINNELAAFVCSTYGLPEDAVAVAVVGMRLASEHEDECCVTIELSSEEAQAKADEVSSTFLKLAKKGVSKGAKPDRVRVDTLPRNFKGAVKLPDLKEIWKGSAAA